MAARGPAALDDFYAAALRLTGHLAADWRDRWRAGALAVAELTGEHLSEIGAQVAGHLGSAGLWRIDAVRQPAGLRHVRAAHHLPGRAGGPDRVALLPGLSSPRQIVSER